MVAGVLARMQSLIARLYDVPVDHEVDDFLLTDRHVLEARTGVGPLTDEQLVLVDPGTGDALSLALYIDAGVLERLGRQDPFECLDARNLADYCTAFEGVSHFHYVAFRCGRFHPVSLLELELQAEVDKYAAALVLIAQQGREFPALLHRQLFGRIRYAPGLDADSLHRYRLANRHAARFCRHLDERYLRRRRVRVHGWLEALRRFYRLGHGEKIRQVAYA